MSQADEHIKRAIKRPNASPYCDFVNNKSKCNFWLSSVPVLPLLCFVLVTVPLVVVVLVVVAAAVVAAAGHRCRVAATGFGFTFPVNFVL